MFKLKDYQEKTHSTLDAFFRKLRMAGLEAAPLLSSTAEESST